MRPQGRLAHCQKELGPVGTRLLCAGHVVHTGRPSTGKAVRLGVHYAQHVPTRYEPQRMAYSCSDDCVSRSERAPACT